MAENAALKLLLDKQITGEQFKIIEDYKRTAESLEREQERKKSSSLKLEELQKKVANLELMNSTSARESMRYQRSLQKLEDTQNYATQLLKLKYQSYLQMQDEAHLRRQRCEASRQQLAHDRLLSHSLHDRRRGERIHRIKEDHQRVSLDLKLRASQFEATLRERREEAREQELRGKERRRRYEVFKLQRAALNYSEKVEREMDHFRQQTRHLQDLRGRMQREEHLFRKTQALERETHKIESIYLTGADL